MLSGHNVGPRAACLPRRACFLTLGWHPEYASSHRQAALRIVCELARSRVDLFEAECSVQILLAYIRDCRRTARRAAVVRSHPYRLPFFGLSCLQRRTVAANTSACVFGGPRIARVLMKVKGVRLPGDCHHERAGSPHEHRVALIGVEARGTCSWFAATPVGSGR